MKITHDSGFKLTLFFRSAALAILAAILPITGCNKQSPNGTAKTADTPTAPPLPNALSEADAWRITNEPAVADVRFGTRYLLIGVSTNLTPAGLKLDFAWQSLIKQTRDSSVPIHVVNAEGKILAQADYIFDKEKKEIEGGVRWLDTVTIPYGKLIGATALAFGVLHPDKQWELPDRGERDWKNRRLLLPLPRDLPQEGFPFTGNFEVANCNFLAGWVWNQKESNSPISLGIVINGRLLTKIVAQDYRKDLEVGGLGDGKHGFRIPTPPELLDGRTYRISVRVGERNLEIKNSPRVISCTSLPTVPKIGPGK